MPPPGYEPFLRAICANPADDAPRLVYADWLEENGEEQRAEFIRVQIALFRENSCDTVPVNLRNRLARLKVQANKVWRKELPTLGGVNWNNFQRGFVGAAEFSTPEALVTQHPIAFEVTPLQSIKLWLLRYRQVNEDYLKQIASIEQLSHIETLSLIGITSLIPDVSWANFSQVNHLRNLKALVVISRTASGFRPLEPAISTRSAEVLATSPVFAALSSIVIGGTLDDETIHILRDRFGVAFRRC